MTGDAERAEALKELAGEEPERMAVTELFELLEHENAEVRESAAEVLDSISWKATDELCERIPEIVPLLETHNESVRSAGTSALIECSMVCPRPVFTGLELLLDHERQEVHEEVVTILSAGPVSSTYPAGLRRFVDYLREQVSGEAEVNLDSVFHSLADIAVEYPNDVTDLVQTAVEEVDERKNNGAAHFLAALAKTRPEFVTDAVPVLVDYLCGLDENDWHSMYGYVHVCEALYQLAKRYLNVVGTARPVLQELRESENHRVRMPAAHALAELERHRREDCG